MTKESKEPNNRVLLGALLFRCSFLVVCNMCLSTYRRNLHLWWHSGFIHPKNARVFFLRAESQSLQVTTDCGPVIHVLVQQIQCAWCLLVSYFFPFGTGRGRGDCFVVR